MRREPGDTVDLDMPAPRRSVGAQDTIGTIAAVQAVSARYMPVAGKVVAVNPRLDAAPALVTRDAYADRSALMNAGASGPRVG
ncbi:MAG TPA: hypothetical protein VGD56_21335 [Gemmatirosa sp.]